MRFRRFAVALAGSLALGVVAPAHAGDFSPSTKFSLSSTKVKANPKVKVTVSQDSGEESIKSIEFDIPAGFRLPRDAAVADGEELGSGHIAVALAFLGCSGDAQATFDATITERDRTEDEANQGVKAVWVVDLQFIQIDLLIYGGVKTGWQIKGDVPENDATCPPFTAKVALNKKSSDTQTPIWRNSRTAGKYRLKAIYTSTSDSTSTTKQRVKIHS
jgi:hypothetical protein